MWINRESETFRKLVRRVIQEGNWPIWEMADDRGLDLEEYERLAEEFIDAFEQLTSDVGR